MGFLDVFDNADIMGSLLGISPAAAAPNPPPPPPPPQMQAPPQQPLTPAPPMAQLGGPPMPRFQDQAGSQDIPGMTPPDPRKLPDLPPGEFADRWNPVPNAVDVGTFRQRGAADRFEPPVPTPQPKPPGVQDPLSARADAGDGPIIRRPGAPSPAPIPPHIAMQGRPDTASSGGLSSALGINPDTMRIALASLGKGMSAVGAQRPGTTAGAAFAGGLGGSLEGGEHTRTVVGQEQRQKKNDLFSQSSTAFRDILAAEAAGDRRALTEAHARYYDSLAAMKANGVKGADSWRNSEYGKALQLERQVQTTQNKALEELEKRAKMFGWDEDKYNEERKKVIDTVAKDREDRARRLGIDPKEIDRGTSKNIPFDWDKMTPDQRRMMPDNAWFRFRSPGAKDADKDGYVYRQRDWLKQPPSPDYVPPGAPQQQQVPGRPMRQAGLPSPAETDQEAADIMGS